MTIFPGFIGVSVGYDYLDDWLSPEYNEIRLLSGPVTQGSLQLDMHNAEHVLIGTLELILGNPMTYTLSGCNVEPADLPLQPPLGVDVLWGVEKTLTG